MTTKIVIPCIINGAVASQEFYVGHPAEGSMPIQFQAKWLTSAKQGSVPEHVIKALQDLYKISQETGANFEDLCKYAFEKKEGGGTSAEGGAAPAGGSASGEAGSNP